MIAGSPARVGAGVQRSSSGLTGAPGWADNDLVPSLTRIFTSGLIATILAFTALGVAFAPGP